MTTYADETKSFFPKLKATFKLDVAPFLIECEALLQGFDILNSTQGFADLQWVNRSTVPASKRWKWLDAAIQDDRAGKPVQALGHIFRAVDELFSKDNFGEVDVFLSAIPPSQLSVNLIVGILSITRPASDRLLNREQFFKDAWRFIEESGRDATKLLGNLKGRRPSDGSTARVGAIK